MKGKCYVEAQFVFALRQAESGTPVTEIVLRMMISEATFCRWTDKYTRPGVAEVRRLKQFEDEVKRRKHLVADLTPDKAMRQDA